jgi:hypothetical protein
MFRQGGGAVLTPATSGRPVDWPTCWPSEATAKNSRACQRWRRLAATRLGDLLAERGDLDRLRRKLDAGTDGAPRALRLVEDRGDATTG